MTSEPYDVAVVGGSFAGLAAAMMLARGRRRVAVFDDGMTRNRFAGSGHGFLGMDGMAPQAMRLKARAELLAYPTVRVFDARVNAARGSADDFRLTTAEGEVAARRLILAYGMRDILPDLPGLAACWGKTAIQCPYCHGYEVADQPTGVLLADPGMAAHAALFTEWAPDLIVFANGHRVAAADHAALAGRGVALEPARVVAVDAVDGALTAVVLEDGRRVARSILYLAARFEPAAPLARDLGCRIETRPEGSFGRNRHGRGHRRAGRLGGGRSDPADVQRDPVGRRGRDGRRGLPSLAGLRAAGGGLERQAAIQARHLAGQPGGFADQPAAKRRKRVDQPQAEVAAQAQGAVVVRE